MRSALPPLKLSSPATREFWEIPVIYEDALLLAINKPASLPTSPDRNDPGRPSLMPLIHEGIQRGVPWAKARGLTYLANAHRLDSDTTGVLLLARSKASLVAVANEFGAEKPDRVYVALVRGEPVETEFVVDVKLAPDPNQPGRMRWTRDGKKSITRFRVVERFSGSALVECRPLTERTHQVRIHLKFAGHPIYGDLVYGDSRLYLSTLKSDYRLKRNREERPLTPTLALHLQHLELLHPATRLPFTVHAEWPKDLNVALKFLRRHAPGKGSPASPVPSLSASSDSTSPESPEEL
ncbi:MAG: RNA pseudouridine synthase [Pedosphaera sp.]|nr:RNA pseudouridine synthase [Pedosphaera sp.]